MRKKVLFSFLFIFLALSLSACSPKKMTFDYPDNDIVPNNNFTNNITINLEESMNQEILNEYSQAEFQTSLGNFTIEFFNEKMPITVANFLNLAKAGYFDGIKFHRVIDGFMIQGGDPLTKDDSAVNMWGTGGPGYAIEDEHVSDPELSNVYGSISMANSGPNSGGSQFFINVADNTFLDFDKDPISSKHPVFGKVIDGLSVVEKISKSSTGLGDRPITPIVINKVNLK